MFTSTNTYATYNFVSQNIYFLNWLKQDKKYILNLALTLFAVALI